MILLPALALCYAVLHPGGLKMDLEVFRPVARFSSAIEDQFGNEVRRANSIFLVNVFIAGGYIDKYAVLSFNKVRIFLDVEPEIMRPNFRTGANKCVPIFGGILRLNECRHANLVGTGYASVGRYANVCGGTSACILERKAINESALVKLTIDPKIRRLAPSDTGLHQPGAFGVKCIPCALGGGFSGRTRFARFEQSPHEKSGAERTKDRAHPSREYLFFGGIRSPYLGVQIAGVVLAAFGFSALASYCFFRAFNNFHGKWTWGLNGVCAFAIGLLFWGWSWAGNPLSAWGLAP